jgi:hypothetical protein
VSHITGTSLSVRENGYDAMMLPGYVVILEQEDLMKQLALSMTRSIETLEVIRCQAPADLHKPST